MLLSNKNKVIVRIGGREYAMKGTESEEYIHKVAIYVDKKMQEISENQPPLSISMLSVLTAINLADEVIKKDDEIHRLKKELEEAKATTKSIERDRANIYNMPKKVRR